MLLATSSESIAVVSFYLPHLRSSLGSWESETMQVDLQSPGRIGNEPVCCAWVTSTKPSWEAQLLGLRQRQQFAQEEKNSERWMPS